MLGPDRQQNGSSLRGQLTEALPHVDGDPSSSLLPTRAAQLWGLDYRGPAGCSCSLNFSGPINPSISKSFLLPSSRRNVKPFLIKMLFLAIALPET